MPVQRPTVVFTQALPGDYRRDFVTLPRDYGSPSFERREDVRTIRQTVHDNLVELDRRTGFAGQFASRNIILKPNLVTVYHHMGLVEPDYPETTDPRVLEAVVLFFKQFTRHITIAESSGRGVPTRGSFRHAGYDRLARRHALTLVALEEQPVDRYRLPGVQVHGELLIPRLFSQVVRGEAVYISLPKLKTNLYTGVTLGVKNAMGVIPYNLRQRNHTWHLDRKLVEMLRLIKPDLTIIDGIIGGEGNCPAPLDAVDSRVIISGDHPLQTDCAAARFMGFVPDAIPLLRLAGELGFGGEAAEVVGMPAPLPFRPADPSLTSLDFRRRFPNTRLLVGFEAACAGCGDTPGGDGLRAMEFACRGGCLATTRFAFEMIEREGLPTDFHLTVLLGDGVPRGGARVFFDPDGRPFDLDAIRALPGRKLAVGSCTQAVQAAVDRYVDGCMPFPNSPHMALHQLTGTRCRVMGWRNRNLLMYLVATWQMHAARKRLLRAGERLDVPLSFSPALAPPEGDDPSMPVLWALPPVSAAEARELCRAEDAAMWKTFTG